MKTRKNIFELFLSTLILLPLCMIAGCSGESSKTGGGDSLVFFGQVALGPDKSKKEMILPFIVQGKKIFLDRNRDNVSQPEEWIESGTLPPIKDEAAGVEYLVKEIRLTKSPALVSETSPQTLAMTVAISGKVNYEQIGQVLCSSDPQKADFIHFHGKNRMIFADPDIVIPLEEKIQLRVFFGTNAVGSAKDLGTEAILTADRETDVKTLNETQRFATILPLDRELVPEMKIEMPTDSEPIVQTVLLNEFC